MTHAQGGGAFLWALTVITSKALFICTIYVFLGLQVGSVVGVLYLSIGVLNCDQVVRGFIHRTLRRAGRKLRRMRRLPLLRAVTSRTAFGEAAYSGARGGLVICQLFTNLLLALFTLVVTFVASSLLQILPWEAIVSNSVKEWNLLGLDTKKAVRALGYSAHTIGSSYQPIPVYTALQVQLSQCLWNIINSTAADVLADWLLAYISILSYGFNYISRWLGAGASETPVELDLADYAPYKSKIKEALAMFQQFAIRVVLPVTQNSYDKNHEITEEEICRVSSANAFAYGSSKSLVGAHDEEIGTRIRLIKLHPGKDHLAIRCSLMTVDICDPQCPEFEALSYVWGDFDDGKYVRMDGKPFEVSDSLHEALRHLRREKGARILWIDALSINQNDSEERRSQVLLMGHIYSKASKVVVWLGEDEPLGMRHALLDTKAHDIPGEQRQIPSGMVHVALIHVVASLLRRSWWRRVWVVQELVRGGVIEIQCGRSALSWELFCALVDAIGHKTHDKTLLNSISLSRLVCSPSSMSPFALTEAHVAAFQSLRVARNAWQYGINPDPAPTSGLSDRIDQESGMAEIDWLSDSTRWSETADLLSLVYLFRGRRATDPRDKVFAFMGLADDNDALISPDYNREPSSLSIEFAREHIRQHRSLAVVALAEFARELDRETPDRTGASQNYRIPSWCPALMSTQTLSHGLGCFPFWTALTGSHQESNFAAASGLPIVIPAHEFGAPKSYFDPVPKGSSTSILPVQAVANLYSTIIEDGRFSDASELGAVLTDLDSNLVISKWQEMADHAITRRSQRRDSISSGPLPSWDKLLHLTITAGKFSAMPPSTDSSQRELYTRARNETCRRRRLFVTGNGLLGLGPEELRIGDEVAVLLGMQAPVVLRRARTGNSASRGAPGKHQYLGQAYIHELMVYKGNLGDDVKSGKVWLRDMFLI
ncbi:hypothetical protein E8E14_007096 [Neopestalotiopsis sp. 37M]|nr:hypothetical protein E8E14_007096 [Neopestalotiopsis sp. 37M]